MTVILTNDDGIDAPGLAALQRAIGTGVIVAPQQTHSGCGHQVTTNQPIELEQRSELVFAVAGTPADCTRIALCHLLPTADWVLSGINAGGNLGVDVYHSGTVAAVREAAYLKVPGVAISQYVNRKRAISYGRESPLIEWDLATQLAAKTLDKLMALPIEPGTFWNVNLPHLMPDDPAPEIVFCPLCRQPLPTAYREEAGALIYVGDYSQRGRDPGSDVDVCFSGQIAVTQIQI